MCCHGCGVDAAVICVCQLVGPTGGLLVVVQQLACKSMREGPESQFQTAWLDPKKIK